MQVLDKLMGLDEICSVSKKTRWKFFYWLLDYTLGLSRDMVLYPSKVEGFFVLWTMELMNQFLKNHYLNKAEIDITDESISD